MVEKIYGKDKVLAWSGEAEGWRLVIENDADESDKLPQVKWGKSPGFSFWWVWYSGTWPTQLIYPDYFNCQTTRTSSPDVSMNYIESLLFLDVCIEIVTVKQSALSLFSFIKFGFMCVFVSIFLFFCPKFFPSGVWFIVTVVIFVACRFVTCFNKDQSINQSIKTRQDKRTCRDCRCSRCCRCNSAIWLASTCPTSRCNLSHSCLSCFMLVCQELA